MSSNGSRSPPQVDIRKLSCPESVGDALHRFRRNTNDFGYNYTLVLLFVAVACVVTKPFSLMVIAALAMLWVWVFYVRASEFHYNGQTYSLRAQAVAMVMFSAFVLMIATNVSQVLMGELTGGFLLCVGHSVVRAPEPPPEGDAEAQGIVGGFTEAVSGAAKSGYSQLSGALGQMGDMVPNSVRQQFDKVGINF